MSANQEDSDPQIEKLFEQNISFARDQMRTQGGMHPMYALNIGPTTIPIVADFESQEAKERIVNRVRAFIVAFWPNSVAFMMESWLSETFDENGDAVYPRASQDPDRKEGVLVVISTPEQEQGRVLITQRDAQGNVTDLIPSNLPTGDLGGLLAGLYPKTPPTRQVQRQARRALEGVMSKQALDALKPYARSPQQSGSVH